MSRASKPAPLFRTASISRHTGNSSRLSDQSRISKILLGIAIAGLICYLAFYIYFAFRAIAYPYQIDFGEGFYLERARLLSQGQHSYHDISTYPFVVATHPPVYPLLCAPLIKLFGVTFAAGRVVSFISAMLIGLLIYKIVQRKTADRLIAVIASLLFFASPFVYDWTILFRPDTLGLLFSLFAVYLIFKYEGSRKVYLCIPFFLLAIYTRQSLIAAPIASFIYLFMKDRRTAITGFGAFVASAGLLFLVANSLTDGQFYLHTIRYNIQSFAVPKALDDLFTTVRIHLIPMSFALYYTLHTILRREHSPFAVYFIASIVVALTVGKVGATINYMLEPIIVSCILIGMSLRRSQLQTILITGMLLVQVFALYHVPSDMLANYRITQYNPHPYATEGAAGVPTKMDTREAQEVSTYIQNAEGKILSEDAGFAVINDKELLIDLFLFTQLARQGIWDQQEFVNDLEQGEFSLIVLNFNAEVNTNKTHFTEEMINAIRNNYQLKCHVGESAPNYYYNYDYIYIYEPRPG